MRELKASTTTIKEMRAETKVLTDLVRELKSSVEGMTPEARATAEDDITKCRNAYAEKLRDLFVGALTTGDVWLGQVDSTAVVHQVVASTLGLTLKEAEEVVNGKRETSRASSDAGKKRATLKKSPIVKVFGNRRATFCLHLSDAIVSTWKESVEFATDPGKIFNDAVAWLNMDKYIMSEDSLKGIVKAIRAMFLILHCESTFIVNGEVGDPGYVRALLGHCSFVSTKVRTRRLTCSMI